MLEVKAAAVVDGSLRGSRTRFGTSMFIIESMIPMMSGVAVGAGTRGPSLRIWCKCRCSMVVVGKPVAFFWEESRTREGRRCQ